MDNRISLRGSLISRNILFSLTGQIWVLGITVIIIPFVVRDLGIERFGILSLAWIIVLYSGILDFGFSRAVTKLSSEILGRGETKDLGPLVWTTLAFQAAIGFLGTVVLILFTPFLTEHFLKISPGLILEARRSFYVLAFSLPVILCSLTLIGLLEAGQRFDVTNMLKASANTAILLLTLAGSRLKLSLPYIFILFIWLRLAAFSLYLAFCFNFFPVLKKGFCFNIGVMGKVFSFGKWATVSSLMCQILTYMERFLIAFVLSVKVLAFYAVPFDILSKISILPFSAAAVLFPSFSYSSGKQRLLKSLFFRPIKYLLFLATPVYITLFIFAKDILGLWMGRDFAQSSAHVFQILTIAFFVNIFSYIPFSAIQGLGRPELKAKLDLVQIPIFLALCLYLIPSFGLVGAAFAKLLITLIDTFGLLWFSKKVLFLSISDLCFLQPGGRAYSKRKFPWPTRKFQL